MRPSKRLRPYNRARLGLVVGVFAMGFLVILGRLFFLQVIRHADLSAQAIGQHVRRITMRPDRGRIVDRHGHVLATSIVVPSISAHPAEIQQPEAVAAKLASILDRPVGTIRQQLTSSAPFVWLARQVPPEVVARLQDLDLPGIYFERESRRYYPKLHLAGQVLGYVGIDEQGLGGLEHLYNHALTGRPRHIMLQRDGMGRAVRLLTGDDVEYPRGADLYLTLDEWLQHVAEQEIAAQVEATRAKNGVVIIMQPQTGDILAMALYPFFNPNDFRNATQLVWQRNRTVTDPVEPGSTFKLIVATASLEENTARPNDMLFCENGLMVRNGRRIRDHEPYGWLRFSEVIEHSSNICTVKLSERLSSFKLYHYIRRFGFGEKTLVDLPGEDAGQLRPPQQWSRFSHASLAIGQEIAVTPIQLLTAYAAVANSGQLMRPRIVERIVDGEEVRDFPPEVRRQVLDAPTIATLRSIFAGVVERGTGKPAAVEGYAVGGKTGTAQKSAAGGYSHSKILASFVGFVPVEEPQLAILVMLDEPQISRWGSQAAGPVFRRVAQEALRYLQIPSQLAKPLTVLAASPPSPDESQVVQGTAPPAVAKAGQRIAQIRE